MAESLLILWQHHQNIEAAKKRLTADMLYAIIQLWLVYANLYKGG